MQTHKISGKNKMRMGQVYELVIKNNKVTWRDIKKMLPGVHDQILSRDVVRPLLKMGVIKKEGQGRGAYYYDADENSINRKLDSYVKEIRIRQEFLNITRTSKTLSSSSFKEQDILELIDERNQYLDIKTLIKFLEYVDVLMPNTSAKLNIRFVTHAPKGVMFLDDKSFKGDKRKKKSET